MGKAIMSARVAVILAALAACVPSDGRLNTYYVVGGVEDGDMLKLRAGPGTGYRILLGIPNGTVLRVRDCQQTGGTRWCEVTVKGSPTVSGYVSWAYLRER